MTDNERPQEQPAAPQPPAEPAGVPSAQTPISPAPSGTTPVPPSNTAPASNSVPPSNTVPERTPQPIRRPRRNPFPPVTSALIALCILVALVQYVRPHTVVDLFFYPPVAYLQPWRFITSAFLHSGIMHILFNLYALILLGLQLEPYLGKARFLTLYLASAVAGNLAVIGYGALVDDLNVGVVGASGAIFGLFGAMLVVSRAHGINTSGLSVVLLINFALVFVMPNISWQSHLGGFVIGALIMFVWDKLRLSGRRFAKARTTTVRDAVLVAIFVLVLVALGALVV